MICWLTDVRVGGQASWQSKGGWNGEFSVSNDKKFCSLLFFLFRLHTVKLICK